MATNYQLKPFRFNIDDLNFMMAETKHLHHYCKQQAHLLRLASCIITTKILVWPMKLQ